jgi:hypothetical protein
MANRLIMWCVEINDNVRGTKTLIGNTRSGPSGPAGKMQVYRFTASVQIRIDPSLLISLGL